MSAHVQVQYSMEKYGCMQVWECDYGCMSTHVQKTTVLFTFLNAIFDSKSRLFKRMRKTSSVCVGYSK